MLSDRNSVKNHVNIKRNLAGSETGKIEEIDHDLQKRKRARFKGINMNEQLIFDNFSL